MMMRTINMKGVFSGSTLIFPQSRALLWFPGHWLQSDKEHYEEHLDRNNIFMILVNQTFLSQTCMAHSHHKAH